MHYPRSHGTGDIAPGDRLGRYEILIAVAQGGMARVWAAKQHGQRGFSKIVAIKTILPHLAQDETFERMFLDEARVAAGVHHPNVCEIFDLGEEDGVLYLAMEWVEGESLARVLKPGTGVEGALPRRLEPHVAAKIIAEASGGLHAAHELTDDDGQHLDVVHRDVSPQNVLIALNGAVKVTDFGVAKALGMTSEITSAGQIKGKAPYMSPEQAAGQQVDRRSDVFALGTCLYEASTGKRPFTAPGGNQVQIIRQILSGQFQPPSAHVPDYPPELEAIVLRAMAMSPDDRYATAEELKTALEAWIVRSGTVVTQTHIGAELQARLGHAVSERQERIKYFMRQSQLATDAPNSGSLATIEPGSSGGFTGIPASGPTTHSAHSHVTSPTQTSPMRTALLGVAVGLGAFLLIGGAIVTAWLAFSGKDEPATLAAVDPPTSSAPLTQPSAPTTAAVTATSASDYITVRTVPVAGVQLQLGDVWLKSGVNQVPRPSPGTTQRLVARAEGYEDLVLNLEFETPANVDLVLTARAQAGTPTPPRPNPNPTPRPTPTPTPTPKPKPAPKPVDIPDNPFD